MAEINVVPYIDVMLVLLVIFMVTAPLLYQGVHVDLPQTSAEPLPPDENEPVVVGVDSEGRLYLSVGETPDEPISADELVSAVAAIVRQNPEARVMVRGDRNVAYGSVVEVMARLQQAGVPQVGLVTEPAEVNRP
jgi:biopolymer transport protein TolR